MKLLLKTALPLILFVITVSAQQPVQKPAWNVTLEAGRSAPSTLTVQNRCSNTHNFQISPQSVPFLQIGQEHVQVAGGNNNVVPVRFSTVGMEPGVYQGQVLVTCLSCNSEPTCTQDREVLPVILTVTGAVGTNDPVDANQVPATFKKKDPCEVIEESCEDLLNDANRKEAEAAGAQDAADEAKGPADAAAEKAAAAEEASKKADEMAEDDPSDYKANVNGQEYSSADVAYRVVLQNEINTEHAAGEISDSEHKSRTEANTTKKAREERLKNKERLKKEAAEAKAAADAARKAADEAKKVADAAQKAADEARVAADAARKAYEDCVKRIEEECRKAKAEQDRLDAEAKAAAADAEKTRIEEEKRKTKAAAEAAAAKAHQEYLIDNIRKLGLIDSSGIGEVPSIWQWLPDWLETPVSMLAEGKAGVPIPTDTLKALGGLYGIIGKLLDPCTALGKSKTVERLQEMINPKTDRKYTLDEALDKTEEMCELLRKIKAKLEAVRQEQLKRGLIKD